MQDVNKALVFVGMPGAGKSICVELLKEKGLPLTYFGGITIEELGRRGLEVNEANERIVREDIRAKEGKGAYATRILNQVQDLFEHGHGLVVVDGLYSWTEYKIFKDSLGQNAIIIAVVAPRLERHARLAMRPRRPLSPEESDARDYAEIEHIEKGGPIANADYSILNDGTVAETKDALTQLLAKLKIEL
ncbi:MAG TPA: AAA family ATPase [Candidatus Saccharimonadia bacterium]|nr:AAA family ATPase [Candidatus Saccharimonadia bacterium]